VPRSKKRTAWPIISKLRTAELELVKGSHGGSGG
jgi:hypothetical protein